MCNCGLPVSTKVLWESALQRGGPLLLLCCTRPLEVATGVVLVACMLILVFFAVACSRPHVTIVKLQGAICDMCMKDEPFMQTQILGTVEMLEGIAGILCLTLTWTNDTTSFYPGQC